MEDEMLHGAPSGSGAAANVIAEVKPGLMIRRAVLADAAALSAFGARQFRETFGPDNDPKDMEAYCAEAFTAQKQQAEISDPARVILLLQRAVPDAAAGGHPSTSSDGAPLVDECTQAVPAEAHAHGREQEAERGIAGSAMLRIGATEKCIEGLPFPIELQRFYVDSPFHGTGAAQHLMAAVLQVAQQALAGGGEGGAGQGGTLWLGVWEHNKRARRFYAKCGFKDVGEHVFQLGRDAQTDTIMAMPIGIGIASHSGPRQGPGVS